MKIRRICYMVLLAVLVAAVFPTVSAYMVKRTTVVNNQLIAAVVSCEVDETFDNSDPNTASVKSSVKVQNTGNVDAYVRLRILVHMEDSKGNIVAKEVPPVSITYNSSDWVFDAKENTYYCKQPVKAGLYSPEFLTNSIVLSAQTVTDASSVVYTYYPVVEIISEAIQSLPVEAVEKSWGVNVSNGLIISVKTDPN